METVPRALGRHHCTCLFSVVGAALGLGLQGRLNPGFDDRSSRCSFYEDFGWASAKLDDVVNWIPARYRLVDRPRGRGRVLEHTIGPSKRCAAVAGRAQASQSEQRKTEAAMAGALGVQLGGTNFYAGLRHDRPLLGDPQEPLLAAHIDSSTAHHDRGLSDRHRRVPGILVLKNALVHGGNVHAAARELRRPIDSLLDFSASINPLGPRRKSYERWLRGTADPALP